MGKRKQGGLDVAASMPWPAGIVLGLLGYVAIRHGIGWYLGSSGNPVLSALGQQAAAGSFAALGWMLLGGCWIAAILSFTGRKRRRGLLDAQTGIDSLRRMSWRQFELLAGEAFRRQGYAIEETGLGGADGGIDLVLRRAGQTTLVQCKQWRTQHVGVSVVREMYGLLVHHRADAVKIVALGDYTGDARRFAHGKPIELVHGGELLATVRALQTRKTETTRPIDSPLALAGGMLAGLLVIAALAPSGKAAPSTTAAPPPATVMTPQVSAPSPALVRRAAPRSTPHAQATIYASDPQNDAELREWKKRNAEAMRILEKTTKEVPLR